MKESSLTAPPVDAAAAPARKFYLDAARALAIIGVIVVHVSSGAMQRTRGRAWFYAGIFDLAARWAVPVFVMISGALLLDPSRPQTPIDFYKRRLARIGAPLVFWSAAYLLWDRFFMHHHRSAVEVLQLLAHGEPYYHLYFLFLIAGLYLVTPLLRVFIERQSESRVATLTLIAVCWSALNALIEAALGSDTNVATDRFIEYVGEYLIGYMLAAGFLPRVTRFAPVLFLAGFGIGLAALLQFARAGVPAFDRYGGLVMRYPTPLVVLMSIGVFGICQRWFANVRSKLVLMLSQCAFGIYLIHPALLDILTRAHVYAHRPNPLVGVPLLTSIAAVASLLITLAARRTRLGRILMG